MHTRISIKPHGGLGKLKFGSTPKEAERYFGKPSATKTSTYANSSCVILSCEYHRINLFAHFRGGKAYDSHWKRGATLRLWLLATSDRRCTLYGVPVVGLKWGQFIRLLKENAYECEYTAENRPDSREPSAEAIELKSLKMTVFARNDVIHYVQWYSD